MGRIIGIGMWMEAVGMVKKPGQEGGEGGDKVVDNYILTV